MTDQPPPLGEHDHPGLSPGQVAQSRAKHGANELTPPPRAPWYKLYFEKFDDPIIRILLVAAVIALGVGMVDGEYTEAVGILIAIFLATTLSFVNEYKAGKEFDLLNRVSDDVAVRVHRGGVNTTVSRRELVVGDIILLENGEEIPADALVLEAVSLLVNESSLTGESVPVAKHPATPEERAAFLAAANGLPPPSPAPEAPPKGDNAAERHSYPPHRLLRGTLIADGHAVAVVAGVGDATEIGRTARAAAEETDTTTPLKKQLERLSRVIGVIGFGMAALIFATMIMRGAANNSLTPRFLIPTTDNAPGPVRGVYAGAVASMGDPDTGPGAAATTVDDGGGRLLRAESDDPTFAVDRGLLIRGRDGRLRTVEIAAAPETAPAPAASLPEVVQNYTIHSRPLSASEWYFFTMLLSFGLIAFSPIWLPIVYDAFALFGLRRSPPHWLERGGGRAWGIAAGTGAAVFGILLLAGRLGGVLGADPATWMPLATADAFLGIFMIAVTIIVVAVPEGLPMSVTLSLAYAMRKMTATNNLVRRMHACETIGAATVICSDKTGTLTQNEMRVAETLFAVRPGADGAGAGAANDAGAALGADSADYHPDPFLAESVAVNATADLGAAPDGDGSVAIGNPTEGALLLWLNVDKNDDYQARRDAFEMTGQLPFSTERKFMATVGRSATARRPVLLVKGAPEIVLGFCGSVRAPNAGANVDTAEPLDPAARAAWLAAIQSRQARGMRALGFAYRVLPENALESPPAELVDAGGLVWLGFAAIADPIRKEVPAAMAACRRAGIAVKVVTGDNADTAREIAREIGLWQPDDGDDRLITGEAYAGLDESVVDEASRKLKIMARARPLAKLRLVRSLQRQGEVVAVTGDGTNDAPALNHADVGLAMGRTGTSTAKEAADIILLDDSFQSIVNAVRWGRSLYSNIQKFILFQLTINVAALGVAVLGPFLGVDAPLTVTQMLWVNLIMDTFATLALATEPPRDSVMDAPPRHPAAFIVTPAMRRTIFGLGGLLLAVFAGVAIFGREVFPLDPATLTGRRNLSLFFNAFVFAQFWNLFNARAFQTGRSALARLGESKPFLVIAAIIALGQVAITQWGGALFRLTPLSMKEWLAVAGGTSVVLWMGELIRKICNARNTQHVKE